METIVIKPKFRFGTGAVGILIVYLMLKCKLPFSWFCKLEVS
jgi:hypothetical protein